MRTLAGNASTMFTSRCHMGVNPHDLVVAGADLGRAMTTDLETLSRRIEAATGSDADLDTEIGRLLGGRTGTDAVDYTASVDRTIDLVQAVLPGWGWHLGWNASGILPYATLTSGERRITAAATVPLALLRALMRAIGEVSADEPAACVDR